MTPPPAAPPPRSPQPFGKYELLEPLGSGGMAEVFLARTFSVAGVEKRLVLKRIRPEHARDPRFVQLFIREARINCHLNHPNIVAAYELGKVGDTYYLAMEHLQGHDLNRVVRALRAQGDPLPPGVAVSIIAEVCRGLAYAHAATGPDGKRVGLIHRDVSPHNIFVTYAGEVKLVDFGIARLTDSGAAPESPDPPDDGASDPLDSPSEPTSNTSSSRSDGPRRPGGGKFAYMSPEQSRGLPLDGRSDLFSAGIVLWELLTGERLYRADDPDERLRRVQEGDVPSLTSLAPDLDPRLAAIVHRALSADPAHRHPSAAAFEEDLRTWLYEAHERSGRASIAQVMSRLFPADQAQDAPSLDLSRLAADLSRLDPQHSKSTHSTGSSDASPTPAPLVKASQDERKRVAVLYLDVEGFTDISATVEPEQLFQQHLQLYRWLASAASAHGGTVQRLLDEQVTVFFGVPRTRTDDLRRALACALELQRRVPELHERGLSVHLAIGVHVGDVTLSHGRGRVRYTSRGDTTRLARRLSEAADLGRVLVSDAVAEAAADEFHFDAGPSLRGRGRRATLQTWALLSRRATTGQAARSPWLRRAHELDTLRDALASLGEGRGAAVLLRGDAGSGKSRLVRELSVLAERRNLPVYVGRATAFGQPLRILAEVILDLLDLSPDAPAPDPTSLDALRPFGLFPADIEALGSLIGTHRPGPRDAFDPWLALTRLARGLAANGPFALILEDAHHLPLEELTALARLVRRLADHPVFLLITWQGPIPAPLHDVTTVELGAFPQPLQRRLVCALLSVVQIDDALLHLVERTCEGNPLYIEELVKYLLAEGMIQLNGSRAELATDAAALPDSLAGLIAARIDALDPAAKGVLQIAAVAGASFSLSLLGEVIGVDNPGPIVDLLHRHGLVNPADAPGTWTFASDFVREAAMRSVLRVQQRDHHRLLAEALERRLQQGQAVPHEALAEHCGQGGRPLDAARYAYTAGQQHEDAHQLARASEAYRQGLVWMEQVPESSDTWDARLQGEVMLRLRLGAVCLLRGEATEGLRSLRLALDAASEADLSWLEARAHLELGKHFLSAGDPDRADAHLAQARIFAQLDDEPGLQVDILEAMASLAHTRGDERASELWQEGIDAARGDEHAQARCLVGLAGCHLRAGDTDAAEPLLKQALAAARQAGDRLLYGRILNNIGLLHSWTEDFQAAVDAFREALQVREDLGYTRGAAVSHHNIGDVHFLRGDLTRAWVSFQRSRDLAADTGWMRGVALNEVYLGFIDATRGDASAIERIARGTEDARRYGDIEIAVTGAWLHGRALATHGDTQGARIRLHHALQEARSRGMEPVAKLIERSIHTLPPTDAPLSSTLPPPNPP